MLDAHVDCLLDQAQEAFIFLVIGTYQLDQSAELCHLIVDRVPFKMAVKLIHQVEVPVPKADLSEELSKLQACGDSHVVKSPLRVVLEEEAELLVFLKHALGIEYSGKLQYVLIRVFDRVLQQGCDRFHELPLRVYCAEDFKVFQDLEQISDCEDEILLLVIDEHVLEPLNGPVVILEDAMSLCLAHLIDETCELATRYLPLALVEVV